jgi:hypothetical protein
VPARYTSFVTSGPRARTFYRARVGVLLAVLAGVVLYAVRDVRSRRERKDWDRTLDVAVVLLRLGPIDDDAVSGMRKRLGALDARLALEMHRYRPGAPHPFAFTLFGPVDVDAPPPPADGDGVLSLAGHEYALWRYLGRVDAAAGVDKSAFDSRVYVAARRPKNEERQIVEGQSEQDGRVGSVEVELDATMVDFTLFVVAHELFHTLGASDKYDASGRTLVPAGLAEPDRVPRYPQIFVELMARNRPVSSDEEKVPESLDELAVGATTAKEIGWTR